MTIRERDSQRKLEVARQALQAALALLDDLDSDDEQQPQDNGVPGELCDSGHNPLGSQWTFRRLCHEGAFPSFRLGRRLVAKRSDVLAYVESCQLEPNAQGEPSNVESLDDWTAKVRREVGA